jgi:hypothetical protein
VKQNNRTARPVLESGQVWRMDDANLHVELIGKLLVHYKLFRGNAKRAPVSLAAKGVVESYLKKNKAVLVD